MFPNFSDGRGSIRLRALLRSGALLYYVPHANFEAASRTGKDRVTIEQARVQLQSFWPELLLATASTETAGPRRQRFLSMGLEVSTAARGFTSRLRSQFARPLYVLGGIVGLILLVSGELIQWQVFDAM